jgi:hypothetical protein
VGPGIAFQGESILQAIAADRQFPILRLRSGGGRASDPPARIIMDTSESKISDDEFEAYCHELVIGSGFTNCETWTGKLEIDAPTRFNGSCDAVEEENGKMLRNKAITTLAIHGIAPKGDPKPTDDEGSKAGLIAGVAVGAVVVAGVIAVVVILRKKGKVVNGPNPEKRQQLRNKFHENIFCFRMNKRKELLNSNCDSSKFCVSTPNHF